MTFLEKLKLEFPDVWENASENAKEYCLIGCPYSYKYEKHFHCAEDEIPPIYSCKECWNREIPEEAAEAPEEETVLEIKKEERKMGKLDMSRIRTRIADRIAEQIDMSMVQEALETAIENYDFSDQIEEAIGTVVEDNLPEFIGDIADECINEAVSDVISDALY